MVLTVDEGGTASYVTKESFQRNDTHILGSYRRSGMTCSHTYFSQGKSAWA